MEKNIVILHHLGLGDIIDCNGIVRHYASMYDKTVVYSKPSYLEIMKYMYRDNKKIEVISTGYDTGWETVHSLRYHQGEKLIIGYDLMNVFDDGKKSCSQIFYDIAKLPYEKKYTSFYFQRNLEEEEKAFNKLNEKNEKYIFVHDDESRGYKIDIQSNFKIIKNDPSINLFNLIKIFENAEEIHCMSSSVLCLLDCLTHTINFKKLFLHKNIRNNIIDHSSLNKKWEILT